MNDQDARCQRVDLDPNDFGMLAELPAQAREVPRIVPLTRDLEPQASGAAMDHMGVLSWMHRQVARPASLGSWADQQSIRSLTIGIRAKHEGSMTVTWNAVPDPEAEPDQGSSDVVR
jgi:hypothetical protein